ncbi:MAG: LLM class flavin-dependent oxidoreductase [Gammaproteobacteria bacterium]|nr:LLM class flavin-dependent oxidoreductase [Gammaproteobacteria bacterium]NND38782.1 LLM class flavin-dependent oxidoreductase [Pseudomonadales bacterium]MBT8150911.1 LLM class flavin-dependent oxidoreductase [Gammaproteobacteria bacterium]NNL10921.1 LLM class flavin-dependent oxidoreductase [Pseudomonadales bacterium]NNM10872.1 LLM class flavin-dependent oxidoreductase [Pseudomonadales bacterium]
MLKYSLLDLCPVCEGQTPGDSLANSLGLAQRAERLGYTRYWVAEHHNMPGIASAATAVVIAHIAAGTRSIRVGAGGIMLPNHSPLQVAEQFGTLETLFPGRVDLGLGRAPGTDQATAYALRRNLQSDERQFPQDVMELLNYFRPAEAGQKVRAIPGEGLNVPVWILGSSLFGAELAAALGLPYAFASHFAPADLMPALKIYREKFKPSIYLAKPYAMAALNVFAASSDDEAQYLASSLQQSFVKLRLGTPGKLSPPKEKFLQGLGPIEQGLLQQVMSCSAIGSEKTVSSRISDFYRQTQVDEIILASTIYDFDSRIRSFDIAANVIRGIN